MTQPDQNDLSAIDAATIAINQLMDQFDGHHSVWLFGYGSLDLQGGLPLPATPPGQHRRLDAALLARLARPSRHAGGAGPRGHHHRGSRRHLPRHGLPGHAGSLRPPRPPRKERLSAAGHRHHFRDERRKVEGLVYIATPDNTAFLGAASEQEIARHIARSTGPSGPNSDYLITWPAPCANWARATRMSLRSSNIWRNSRHWPRTAPQHTPVASALTLV